MAYIVKSRVRDTTRTVGSGPFTLDNKSTLNFRPFSAVMAAADVCPAYIVHRDVNEWEVSDWVYSAPGILTRSAVIESSNANAAVSFSEGVKDVFMGLPAARSPILDNTGKMLLSGRVTTKGILETVQSVSIVGNAVTFNLDLSSSFRVSLTGNITTINITNMVAGMATTFQVEFVADGTQRSVTMPASVVPIDASYTPSYINGKRDLLSFVTMDGGTTWLMGIAKKEY